jgi:serine O-acetyltransferase
VLRRLARLSHSFWSIVTASDIRPQARLGRNLRMPHPTGVVIHHDAVIGDDCILMQQVTIGQLAGPGAPVIGDKVYVGAGAKVLGAISIGEGARIGANAVVLQSVPPYCTAVGVPARVVRAGGARQETSAPQ